MEVCTIESIFTLPLNWLSTTVTEAGGPGCHFSGKRVPGRYLKVWLWRSGTTCWRGSVDEPWSSAINGAIKVLSDGSEGSLVMLDRVEVSVDVLDVLPRQDDGESIR